ncbi:hypothetical protein EDD15DRAFT_2206119 [Pisolithus albus]|nr:hypothetical protein EDD15DRAFT_2206119 [Pisolithus albus]
MADETRWLVIGGGSKAGIYRACPVFPCGRSTPPLPIAIECESEKEARQLHCIFQQTLKPLPQEPSPSDILTAFQHSETVRHFFPDGTRDFYAVAIGAPAGIHCTRHILISHVHVHTITPKLRHTEPEQRGQKALAFMIVKGQDTRMLPLLTSAELAQDLHNQVRYTVDRQHDNPISRRHAPEAFPTSSPASSSSSTPMVYIHVRNLSGVITVARGFAMRVPDSQIVSTADLQYSQSPQITHQIFSEASDYQTVRTTHHQIMRQSEHQTLRYSQKSQIIKR